MYERFWPPLEIVCEPLVSAGALPQPAVAASGPMPVVLCPAASATPLMARTRPATPATTPTTSRCLGMACSFLRKS